MITYTKLFGRQIGYEYNQQYATSSLASARDHTGQGEADAVMGPRLQRVVGGMVARRSMVTPAQRARVVGGVVPSLQMSTGADGIAGPGF